MTAMLFVRVPLNIANYTEKHYASEIECFEKPIETNSNGGGRS